MNENGSIKVKCKYLSLLDKNGCMLHEYNCDEVLGFIDCSNHVISITWTSYLINKRHLIVVEDE